MRFYKFALNDKTDRNVSLDLRFRVQIRRNAYNDQSWVRGSIMDPVHLKWNVVVERPIETAWCKDANYVSTAKVEPFRQDALSVTNELKKLVV